jgi:arginase
LFDSQRLGRGRSSRDRFRSPIIGLVEVDCDLGAGIVGAAAGIELLRQASRDQKALRRIHEELIEEIATCFRSPGPASASWETGDLTPHARHIHTIHGVMEEVATRVAFTRRRGLFPVVLAGDHSTVAGTIAGLRRAHPECRLGVVWIDAHADLHSPYTTPSGNMHGMPLAAAAAHDNHLHGVNNPDPVTLERWERCKSLVGAGCGAIRLSDLVYVSVRDIEPAEDATIRSHGIPVVSTEEVRGKGPEQAALRCLDHLRDCELIYVSFDVDSMDETVCVGTGTPASGGLWVDEAIRINCALLADPRVCCWEICEINPHLDTLGSLAEVSLGVYQAVLGVLEQRFLPGDDLPAELGDL